jgi:hypothetical protein
MRKAQLRKARKLREKRRKQKIALAQALLVAAAVFTLALILAIFTNPVELTEASYIVCEGDTLWALHSEYGSDVRWDRWLHEMLDVNGMGHNDDLIPGERIILLTAE